MITVDICLTLLFSSFANLLIAYIIEQHCSCYVPCLLSAKYYFTIKNRRLRSILIGTQSRRAERTAFQEPDKIAFAGCIHCAVIFPWLLFEILITIMVLILVILESDFIYSPFITKLISFELSNKIVSFLFILGTIILYELDYYIGKNRYSE